MAAAEICSPPTPPSDEGWAGAFLGPNLQILSKDQRKLARALVEDDQTHLFKGWPEPGFEDAKKLRFFEQVKKLNESYSGGLSAYIRKARKLLEVSRAGINPFTGYVPSVPAREILSYGDGRCTRLEGEGVKYAKHTAFVLVAGGLGERLGYSGIKIALPAETTTGTCFLKLYIENILALQKASNEGTAKNPMRIPFVIMTSDDTHQQTEKLLKEEAFFGMQPDQVHLLKQEKVACLSDNDARLALDPADNFLIQTKPHGHGDVHSVLWRSKILHQWDQAGVRWVVFFQDTNGLLFKAIPASLGVSVTKNLDVNSLAVRRKAKEPIGGIAKLTHENGSETVINVEYNQLDPLLRATGHPDGDVNDQTGFSPYPGNINQTPNIPAPYWTRHVSSSDTTTLLCGYKWMSWYQDPLSPDLVLKLSSYIEELRKTNGTIVEFVNPKYKDAGKTIFKSSTRLECMMQDYPSSLPSSASVGVTVMDTWLAYAPVKNSPEDAQKVPSGNPWHSATSGEMAIYKANCLILKKVPSLPDWAKVLIILLEDRADVPSGLTDKFPWPKRVEAHAKVDDPVRGTFNGQDVEVWPRIVWSPKWALTFADVLAKINGLCHFTKKSTLVLDGESIILDGLQLDGALVVRAHEGSICRLTSVCVSNTGWNVAPVHYTNHVYPEETRIRGFYFEKIGQQVIRCVEPGMCTLRNVEVARM